MVTSEQWSEWIYDGIGQTAKFLFIILESMLPGIVIFMLVGLITLIIKKGFLRFLFQVLIIRGDSKRAAHKKIKKVGNVIDLGISANDIHNIFK